MRLVRGMRGNAQTWDPLSDMVDRLSSSKATAARQGPDLKLPGLSHAECLALRALTHCDQDAPRALTLLQEWGANICDRKPDGAC
jgi:hypothetical protein